MTKEEAEAAIKEYADYAAKAHLSAPAAWFVTEASSIVLEALKSPEELTVSAKPFPYNKALHEAEAALDKRLADIKKVKRLAERALAGAVYLLLNIAQGGV